MKIHWGFTTLLGKPTPGESGHRRGIAYSTHPSRSSFDEMAFDKISPLDLAELLGLLLDALESVR
jgi:hypothetical protein